MNLKEPSDLRTKVGFALSPGYKLKWEYVIDISIIPESSHWTPVARAREPLNILHAQLREENDNVHNMQHPQS